MNKNILIFGGGGFLGQAITKVLCASKFKVIVLDRFFYQDIKNLLKHKNIKYIKEDVRKINSKIFENIDVFIDLSNLGISPKNHTYYDRLSWEVNYQSRYTNLLKAKNFGVKQYLFTSSCSVYGFSNSNSYLNEESKIDPKSTYAKTQKEFEYFATTQGNDSFKVTSLRLPTLYGTSQRTRFDLIINSMVFDILKFKKIKLVGDGKQRRPFLHVKDAAEAFLFFIKNNKKKINNEVFNIGDKSNNININNLATLIFKVLKISKNIEFYGDLDDRSYFCSFDKINKLGYKAKRNLVYGINELKKVYLISPDKNSDVSKNIIWLSYLEKLNSTKNLSKKEKLILTSKILYKGILDILPSKKVLVFLGANRESDYKVSTSCVHFLITNFPYDQYKFIVTDDNKKIILFLKYYNLDFHLKKSINKIFLQTKLFEYNFLINIWGHSIFPEKFLNKFRHNLNLHPSFLPYGKGKDSIVWTLFYNYPAGITLHKMTKNLDAGPIYYQEKIKYNITTTGKNLYNETLKISIYAFQKNWSKIRDNKIKLTPQKKSKTKTHYRTQLLKNNIIDLDDKKNSKMLNIIKHSLAQNFSPNFTLKLKIDNKIYNFTTNIAIDKS